jgi:hypothetical protein
LKNEYKCCTPKKPGKLEKTGNFTHYVRKEDHLTEKSSENELLIIQKRRQQKENHTLFDLRDKHLTKNLAAKKVMAVELAEMGLNKESIARLLNLHNKKEE